MKFTLGLKDYIDQYKINNEKNVTNCPVCYEHVMTGSTAGDISHLVSCYKDQCIELEMIAHYDKTGQFPDIDDLWIIAITEKIENEIYKCSVNL